MGLLYWPGVFPKEEPTPWKTENDGVENPESIYTGQFGGVYLNVGPLGFCFYALDFLDDPPNSLPGASITIPFGDQLSISFSGTRNINGDNMLWLLGAKLVPNE